MDNTQADITADLTDKQLAHCYMSAFNSAYDKPGACIHDGQCAGYRAVAALAREGWRPIPKDEGEVMSLFERRSNPCRLVMPAAEGEAQQPSQQLPELAEQLRELLGILTRMGFVPLVPPAWQLRELAEILTRMGFVTLAPPAWPSRLQRAAELLEHPQALERVPARLRRCPTHGQQGPEAWGCPECVQEMRNELVEAREALRRLRRWGGLANDSGFDGEVLLPVVAWIDGGAKGPLPPLPACLGQSLPEGEAQLVHQQAPAPVPAFPPRPPVTKPHHANTVLTRWGIQWNGPEKPIAVPMDDGYWTPWHVADELLRQALVIKPVPASERPWERDGWLHPQGQWCWHWNRGAAGWLHRSLVNGVEDDTLLLPHWAISAPGSPYGDAS